MRLKRAFRVWQRNFTVYTKLYKSSIALNFVEPVLYLAALGLGLGAFVKEINGVPYINFIAPGIIASSAMFAATYECTYGTYVRMTYQKTFDAILATPVNIDDLVAGELMWGATKSMLYGTIIMIVISIFGLVDSPLIMLAIPVLFISGLIFAEISMIFAAIVPGIDSFNYFYTLFMTPMFLFSGIFFPLNTLPPVISKIAFFTPLYHLVNICRAFASGLLSLAVWDIVWIFVVVVILAPYPFRLMRRRIIK
ncbi:MAG: ABC transporter permease [Nitrospiraceae bacterium]|nr:ABC transporter permease [Nitrospiraceae bacterium]MDA8338354.1 ABC transporter permease [Nitrospiraceae bacterium]